MMNPAYKDGQIFMHAEIDAIRNALRLITQEQLARCTLHIVRVKRPHNKSTLWRRALAKPCKGCERVIASFGIQDIKWTEDEHHETIFRH